MQRETQAKSGLVIKKLLLDRHQTVAGLARKLRRPRSSVSQAIHQGRFPRIRELLEKELGL